MSLSEMVENAKDFAAFTATKLEMPFLVLTGDNASGTFLIDQTKLVATNVTGTVVQGQVIGGWRKRPARLFRRSSPFLNEADAKRSFGGIDAGLANKLSGDFAARCLVLLNQRPQNLFGCDRQIANAHADSIVNRVSDRRRHG